VKEEIITFHSHDVIWRRFKISSSELSFSQRQRKIAKARFTPIEISSLRGTIYRLGELILMFKKKLRK